MNEFITVYSAEVMRRLRSRAFLVGLVIGAFGIFVMLKLPGFVEGFTSQSNRIALAGDPAVISAARPLLKKDFHIGAALPGVTRPSAADLESHGKASAVIVLVREPHGLRASIYAKDPGAINTAQLRRDLLPLNIGFSTALSAKQVAALMNMPVDVHPLASKFGTAAQADQARVVANVLIFLLYLLIVLNSQLIMTSVAEEKTSRIAELLVASVNPKALLAGKIAASASLAIVQMVVWVAIGFAVGAHTPPPEAAAQTASASASGGDVFSLTGISSIDIAGFVIFFLLGYLQMATMFAAIGSLINRTEDIGSIGGPFFIPVIAALLIAITALEAPDAPFVVVTSFIPLIAPFVMFARIVVSSVPLWQIGLSFAINVAAIYAIAVLAGKIYRIGMLLYGRPPKLAQLWHALRA
jgi:ABC-2 type transport system permease protein